MGVWLLAIGRPEVTDDAEMSPSLTTSAAGRAYDFNRVVGGREIVYSANLAFGQDDDVYVVAKTLAALRIVSGDVLRLKIGAEPDDEEFIVSFREVNPGFFDESSLATVAVSPELDVYVTDELRSFISVFDRDGKFMRNIGEPGTGPGQFDTPHGIAVSPDDEVYVADGVDHVVRKYATSGEQLQVLGSPGHPGLTDGPFNQPTCAVRSAYSGERFVSDGYRQNRIHRFSNDGDIRLSWGRGDRNQFDWEVSGVGEPLTGPGEFNTPHSVTVGEDDRVYVMDRSNHRIQTFDENGKYLSQ